MPRTIFADQTTLAQLINAIDDTARLSILDSRLGNGTLTAEVLDGTNSVMVTGTITGTAWNATAVAVNDVQITGDSGTGGTPASDWSLKISNGAGDYVQFPKGCWSFLADGGDPVIDPTADNLFLTVTFPTTGGGTYVPSIPPAGVQTWIASPVANIQVPQDFLGIHSDYLTGSAYIVDPGWLDKIGTVRMHDYDPNKGGAGQISWAAIEQSPGVYTWDKMDAWVTQYSTRLLVYTLFMTPSFYAKYSTAYNLYGSYPNGASPPTDWTKALDFILAIKARYPPVNFIFELWNEPLLPWSTETGGAITTSNMYDTRCSDTWKATVGRTSRGEFYIGTARDLAEGAKALYQGGVRPLYGFAWQGHSTETNATYSRLNRMLSCPTTGGGVGKDWLDGISVHHYTYAGDGREMLQEGTDFKARFAQFGVSSLPWMWSEVGHETVLANTLSDVQHTTNVIRWCYIAAAQGASNLHMYQLDTDDLARNLKFYAVENTSSKIATNDALQGAIETAYAICGKTIGQAARLTDGSIWMEFTDGTQVRR